MEKFIPYEKLSKKKQRELNAARRTTWALNPVTRKPANPKAYNRKTARNWKDDSNSVPFESVFILLKSRTKQTSQGRAARATWLAPLGRMMKGLCERVALQMQRHLVSV